MKTCDKMHLARICIAREPEVKENSSVEDKTLISGFSSEGNHSTSFQIHRFLILLVRVPFAQYSLLYFKFYFL